MTFFYTDSPTDHPELFYNGNEWIVRVPAGDRSACLAYSTEEEARFFAAFASATVSPEDRHRHRMMQDAARKATAAREAEAKREAELEEARQQVRANNERDAIMRRAKETLSDLTQATMRDVFDYDPETGHLIWKKPTSLKAMVGKVAGSFVNGNRYRIGINGRVHCGARLVWLWHHDEYPDKVFPIDGNKKNTKIENLTLQNN
ncbi:hypothetical protein NDN16_09460 [Aureimonas altamirensis]|uniref:hypothetical protein n=1 Tax=Aureimonas altamirensis TaxID=370622 RepID=UPI0020368987|nr:hypothetical protein [Aureimonas altamirensis]MCM2503899.1 hypothetical protein [Aureimonas altamirensis]